MPHHISQPTDTDPFIPKATDNAVQERTKELLCYLWDNYFEINPNSSITLIGVGDAYLGIKQLLISRDVKSKIASILSFVAGSLRPIKSDIDPYLSTWYKANSRIYVSPDHACWNDEESKRKVARSRFGGVDKADIEPGRGKGEVGRMVKRYGVLIPFFPPSLSLPFLTCPLFWIFHGANVETDMNTNQPTGSAAKSRSGRGNRVAGTGIRMRRRMRLRLKLRLRVLRIRGLGCRVLCRVLGFRWSRQALLRLCQAEPWLLSSEDGGG